MVLVIVIGDGDGDGDGGRDGDDDGGADGDGSDDNDGDVERVGMCAHAASGAFPHAVSQCRALHRCRPKLAAVLRSAAKFGRLLGVRYTTSCC